MAKTVSKYDDMALDVFDAVNDAAIAARLSDDGGTCNFDTAYIILPRWQKKKVIEAAEKLGVNMWEATTMTSTFFIGNPIGAMGNRNTVQAEEICNKLKACGYSAGVWYVMD